MEKAGTEKVSNAQISFDFRDKSYQAIRNNVAFQLIRTFDSVKDVLSNNGFQRFVNENPITLSDSSATIYSNAVNSVHYFSVLPFGLNDKAVRKKILPSATLKGKEYYKIEITFSENGGGDDYEDVFVYWFDKEHFTMDYLAYSFHTNGGGKRFRAVKNVQIVEGIHFVNFDNYAPKSDTIFLTDLDKAYENNSLTLVSEIVLENLKVIVLSEFGK
ncbi:MAG: deoxyribose-phosphate aldolase [Flavobacteriaceae bacterium CG_4_8_14_3_um_filter_31_8]|nr:MAG: deoxyribose-phosphate aldolase [Flavobacteriaceae bacterium CG_4_8_14_3_um_filter_31_8]